MKKFLALALAFCMIVTSVVFMPMTVAAENADSIIIIVPLSATKEIALPIVATGSSTVPAFESFPSAET